MAAGTVREFRAGGRCLAACSPPVPVREGSPGLGGVLWVPPCGACARCRPFPCACWVGLWQAEADGGSAAPFTLTCSSWRLSSSERGAEGLRLVNSGTLIPYAWRQWQPCARGHMLCAGMSSASRQSRSQNRGGLLLLLQKRFSCRLPIELIAFEGGGPAVLGLKLACCLVPALGTALQLLHGNIKHKACAQQCYFFHYSSQNRHGLVAAQRRSSQEHETINECIRCRHSIEQSGWFLFFRR